MSQKFLLIGVAMVALAGCTTPWSYHNWYPDGYVGQDSTPISSPKPTTPWFEQAVYSQTIQDANKTAWATIAATMRDRLKAHIAPSNAPLYIVHDGVNSPEKQAFDHEFRQALLQSDYLISADPKTRPMIEFNVKHVQKWDRKKMVEKIGAANVLVPEGAPATQLNYMVTLSSPGPKDKPLWTETVLVPLVYEGDLNSAQPALRQLPPMRSDNVIDNPAFYSSNK